MSLNLLLREPKFETVRPLLTQPDYSPDFELVHNIESLQERLADLSLEASQMSELTASMAEFSQMTEQLFDRAEEKQFIESRVQLNGKYSELMDLLSLAGCPKFDQLQFLKLYRDVMQ